MQIIKYGYEFLWDELGAAAETVAIIGAIAVPLIVTLFFAAKQIKETFTSAIEVFSGLVL